MGVSENVVYPIVANGFHDHYPVLKWLFHWEYTLFSDKPKWKVSDLEIIGILQVNLLVGGLEPWIFL